MNKRLILATTTAVLGLTLAMPVLAAGAASVANAANSAEQLAKDRMCFHCHEVKGEKRGPAFEEVARRYAGQEGVRARLIKAVQSGTASGAGALHHWGTGEKMPRDAARVTVSATEAEQLVDYVLSLKK
ncbi:MAG: c-type cytochrome [Sterolibacterium sp.]|jgi:cytochrome c|nr:c-type cytochrome [Sterolibacterium sp.]